ncbi:response regulator [Butyrivibrio sp. WCE2006]|uniref:response regulator n=1 Tax=Butyrivibrio sp. WCE2006 TaxID=1410611 RepID=UPI0005D23262|nr:response regulator [Butyrivibrio sp. WCE2006]
MDNKVLLISSGSTFMVNAIKKNLTDAGLEVISCEPKVNELEKYRSEPNVFLFYLGPYVDDIPEPLIYLRDICVENEKILCMIGDASEYDIILKSIPGDLIAEKFERPLDIKKVTERIQELCQLNDELSRRKNILLVDDDPTFLKLVKNWLDEEYRVTIVSSGMQAITYLATNTPDLILLDYEMPVTSGPQVLEMIRSESSTSSTPVIFLTGKGDKESVMKVVGLKPNGYLLKSMPKTELLQAVRDFFIANKKL